VRTWWPVRDAGHWTLVHSLDLSLRLSNVLNTSYIVAVTVCCANTFFLSFTTATERRSKFELGGFSRVGHACGFFRSIAPPIPLPSFSI